jgi:hypothetical protein
MKWKVLGKDDAGREMRSVARADWMLVVEMANDQRKLHDRLVKLDGGQAVIGNVKKDDASGLRRCRRSDDFGPSCCRRGSRGRKGFLLS